MRVLFSTGSAPGYMAPPMLGTEQVNCGPDWPDRIVDGRVISLSTPAGSHDLGALKQRLPQAQQPEAVVCLVDAAWRNLPKNLGVYRCPKLLLVADTHHLKSPLSQMVRYAASEPFDRIVFLYDRHHADFFRSAGFRNLFWFPGLTFPHDDRLVCSVRGSVRLPRVAFVGQTGPFHPRRTRLLPLLRQAGVPVEAAAVGQREGLSLYGSSLAGFNASLNGDLNLRVFEILSAGALLLTDRLAPASGLGDLLAEGREMMAYGSAGELQDVARHVIRSPDAASVIARAGQAWFDRVFSTARRRAGFASLAVDAKPLPEFVLPERKTAVWFSSRPGLVAGATRVYERVQELHRLQESVQVVVDESVPEDFVGMCGTLPRVKLARAGAFSGRPDLLAVGCAAFGGDQMDRAERVWIWNGQLAAHAARLEGAGLMPIDRELAWFGRERNEIDEALPPGRRAWIQLEDGDYEQALECARRALAETPGDANAFFTMADLAIEAGNGELAAKMLAMARRCASGDARHALMHAQLASLPREPLRFARMLNAARRAADAGEWTAARTTVERLIRAGISLPGLQALHARIIASTVSGHDLLCRMPPAERGVIAREAGRALLQAGRAEEALDLFWHALDADEPIASVGPLIAAAGEALDNQAVVADAWKLVMEAGDEGARGQWECACAKLERSAPAERDLLVCHVEVTRLQGTGVLLKRFYSDSSGFVTLRSSTRYGGAVEFGAAHAVLSGPHVDEERRRHRIGLLLAPYRIRRILAVPFFTTDFLNACAAQAVSQAPVCTYIMDDQTVHSAAVPREVARALLGLSGLRLVISPEMRDAYERVFGLACAVLPPVLPSAEGRIENDWPASEAPARPIVAGNIWSADQLGQLRHFLRAHSLEVDWFGNDNVPWLGASRSELAADGLHCRGFLPDDVFLASIARCPFVIVPGGMLDGTESNEWLTRLSLPSRMVHILVCTHTPMLVLGSESTCAGRFVRRLGIGCAAPYNSPETARVFRNMLMPDVRGRFIAACRSAAGRFVLPEAGEWLWRSLERGGPKPAPFHGVYEEDVHAETRLALLEKEPAGAGRAIIEGLLARKWPDGPRQSDDREGLKTSRVPLPPVGPEAAASPGLKNLEALVKGRTVGFLLHGSSVRAFADHAGRLTRTDAVWLGMNHFSLLEDSLLKPFGREFSAVFCSAEGEVERRMDQLIGFLSRPGPRLLITRPDRFAEHRARLERFRDSIALEKLPPLWPYPNSLALCLRLLVQCRPARIVLFGSDGYLGEDDISLPTYFGAEQFMREKRYSGILLDTLLFNAHFPQVLARWQGRLGKAFPGIVNCSPGSLIRAFPVIGYEQAEAALRGESLTFAPAVPVPADTPLPANASLARQRTACAEAARNGNLALAREHALQALLRAPARATPLLHRVLQTDTASVATAWNILRQTGAGEAASPDHPCYLELQREVDDALGAFLASRWETWE